MIPWHTALCNLVDLLRADSRFAGVSVFSGAVDPDHAGPESVQITGIEETMEWRALGPGMLEAQATAPAMVWVTRPGGGEEAIRAARARADELRWALMDVLFSNITLGGVLHSAYVSGASYDQGIAADGMRACRVTFQITMSAWIRR